MSEGEVRGTDRWRTAVRILSIVVILGGLGRYVLDRIPSSELIPVPLAPLAVAPGLTTADALSTMPGVLKGYDVLLVTLDTTRPDRLGCYGNQDSATPNLDHLAREGVIFSAAVATGPTTLPTHASILTGLYPQHHGARANSLFGLAEEHGTLAEALSEAGYATGAFVSSFVLDDRFGLAQGFNHYDSSVGASSGVVGYSERKADRTTDSAIEWLGRRGAANPSFLWVHYYDPHAAHDPPSPFRENHELLYDGEIAFVDHELGRLLKQVEVGARKTLVVVVADHGEAFGEHGEWSHGLLLQEATLRIPLIMYATGGLQRGLHVDSRVSQVDLMPTILSLLGHEVPAGLDGVALNQAADGSRAILAEAVEGRAQYGWARLSAIYRNALKYVEGSKPELYDFSQDSLDRENVAIARPAEVATLRAMLRDLEGDEADQIEGSSIELGQSDLQRLQALGYGGGVAAVRQGRGADPKEMLPAMIELQWLTGAYNRESQLSTWERLVAQVRGERRVESREDLLRQLEALAKEHPQFAPVHQFLGFFYDEDGRKQDASRARERFDALTRRN